jgi:hypothetical protein
VNIRLTLAGVTAEITLLDTLAPRTSSALWAALPITDRAVQVKWSGDAWRTDGDYDIGVTEVENEGRVLAAGDFIYYPRMKKIGLAYGQAEWRHPDIAFKLHVSVVGRVRTDVKAIVAASQRVWLEGVQPLRLERVG